MPKRKKIEVKHVVKHGPFEDCDWCVNHSPLEDSFKADVSDKAAEVDPENEMDWGDLTVGYALGKGLRPEDANDFSGHIRYHTDLG